MELIGSAALLAHAGKARAQNAANANVVYGASTIPIGIRSRLIPNINGITMHALEAGYERRESAGGAAGARLPGARLQLASRNAAAGEGGLSRDCARSARLWEDAAGPR